MVQLTNDSDWQEVSVVNFYDPEKHNTVKVEGSTKKLDYVRMKMADGTIYDKVNKCWEQIVPDNSLVLLEDVPPTLPMPYQNSSVGSFKLVNVVERCDDLLELMKECHRTLVPRGMVKMTLPLAPSTLAFSDPETKNYFTESTFRFFLKGNRYDLFGNYFCAIRGETLDITLKK